MRMVKKIIVERDRDSMCIFIFRLESPATKEEVLDQFPRDKVTGSSLDESGTLLIRVSAG